MWCLIFNSFPSNVYSEYEALLLSSFILGVSMAASFSPVSYSPHRCQMCVGTHLLEVCSQGHLCYTTITDTHTAGYDSLRKSLFLVSTHCLWHKSMTASFRTDVIYEVPATKVKLRSYKH